jgi:hypothetical protein
VLALLPLLAHAPMFLLSPDPMFFPVIGGPAIGAPDGGLPGLPGWADPNAGWTTEALGKLAARDWLRGVVPWWNPYSGIGLPLAAEMQSAALFLPFTLLLDAPEGVELVKIALQIVAGWATFALLLQLGLARRVALLGGVLFELNGTFAWLAHAPINPVPFMPLLLLGIERALAAAERGRPRGRGWIAVAVAGSLYAGFPETALIDGLLAAGWSGWRLWAASPGARPRFAKNLVLGLGTGLLLAAPIILPFAQLLAEADLGGRDFAGHAVLLPPIYALLLVPYLYGTIYFGHEDAWGYPGGYLGLAALLLAGLALRRDRPMRGLRRALAGWLVLAAAKSAQLPGVAQLFNLIPFIDRTWFFRYALPSGELAAIVLGCCALDDWQRGAGPRPRHVLAALGATLLVAAAAAPAAWPMMLRLLRNEPDYPVYLGASLLWAALGTALVAMCLPAPATPRRATLLPVTLALHAAVLFAVPLLCGTRPLPLDNDMIGFLRANLGFSRFYTLGPVQPNYSAYFGIASVNHNYLPLPRRWVDYVHAHLDPGADAVIFNGATPLATAAEESRRMALVRRLDAYAAVGVKYVLAAPGSAPFATPPDLHVATGGAPAGTVTLQPGQTLFGGLPAARVSAGRVASVALDLLPGADGSVRLDLCSPRACAFAVAPLPPDAGTTVTWHLPAPLELNDGDDIRYLFTRVEGAAPLDLPVWPQPDAPVPMRTPAGPVAERTPGLVLRFAPFPALPRVFQSPLADIFELPNPAPYFEARGAACALAPAGREAVTADCDGAATLLRRELFDPGWRADVNGAAATVAPTEEIFQAVPLPPGHSRVRYRYAPPFIGWALAACGLGLVGLWRGIRG